MNSWVDNVKKYEDNKLRDLFKSQLTENLISFRKIDVNCLHWKFMHHNIGRTCVIIKLSKTRTSDDLLWTVECNDTLFYLDFHRNYFVSTIDDSIENVCYLVFERVRGKFVQSGLASTKFGNKDAKGSQCRRINGYLKVCTKHQRKVVFYSSYPAMECSSNFSMKKGHFEDLDFQRSQHISCSKIVSLE